ncbi:hypothetical protein RTH74_22645 [Pseudomonas sp. zfem001]|uniref:hypothetical protein n=1 Tax=Pseudomonas sp. zfem001 TaxID=3078196 RepID=UPI0029293470|nr:hypothetical protein [Pseudomonas sp. zfem001]MDU9410408.1 hypothetical protein [Pseudomonas sp. zfem001]
MHIGFDFDPEHKYWGEYVGAGREIYRGHEELVRASIDSMMDMNGLVKAEDILKSWFPSVNADIFLSHSHSDEKVVLGFAGWLHREMGVKAFIDSAVWGYSDVLLKQMDEYAKFPDSDMYNYSKRNRTTSHVHMMLSTALADMIDRCECVIFMNTENSFKASDYIDGVGETGSPWIYHEMMMSRIVRRRELSAHRGRRFKGAMDAALESLDEARDINISYPLNTLHLTKLDARGIERWGACGRKGHDALDALYFMSRSGACYG